jgi:hypothetical protein
MLSESEDLVRHYYGPEREFIHLHVARMLKDFSPAAFENLMASPTFHQPGYPSIFLSDKVASRLLELVKGWNDHYRFAYLAYRTALSYAKKDIEYANIWANIALKVLQISVKGELSPETRLPASANLERDFYQLSRPVIESLPWLNTEVKQSWLDFWSNVAR